MGEDNRLDTLEKKVAHLEYDEISPLKKDVNDIKINLAENNLLTKQTVESNEKLSNTMETMKETMVEITQSLKNGNRISGELTESVKSLNDKVDTVENKMTEKFNEIDEKSKIDWQQWIKSHWFEFVLGLGALSYIISQIIK